MRLLCLDLLLISVIFSDFNRQQKGKISDKDENRSGRRWGYNCSRSSPASYLEAAGTLCEGLFPATPCPGLGQNKSLKAGGSPESCWDPGSPGGQWHWPSWVWMFSSLCTHRSRKRKLWSPETDRKQSLRAWKCTPWLWRETCYLESSILPSICI